jgi:hypothetical protein
LIRCLSACCSDGDPAPALAERRLGRWSLATPSFEEQSCSQLKYKVWRNVFVAVEAAVGT